MIKRIILVLAGLSLIVLPSSAQYIEPDRQSTNQGFEAKQLIAPSALILSGAAIHCFAHDSWDIALRDKAQALRGNRPETTIDDYIQYLPLAMNVGLGLTGIESGHGFVDRTIESFLGFVSYSAIAWTFKLLVDSPRPNGVDNRSFPSGHTGTTFMGAELVRQEYGAGWGTAAYVMAGGIGLARMYNNEHWFSDILAGAGMGILSAHIAVWLLEPTRKLLSPALGALGLDNNGSSSEVSFAPSIDPLSGIPVGVLALRF